MTRRSINLAALTTKRMMSSAPTASGSVTIVDEPLLEFRYGQRLADPRDGLSIFGPCDCDEPAHPKALTYAVVGPAEGVEAFETWSRAMQRSATFLGGKPRLWPTFPGFEAAFAAELKTAPVWQHVLDRAEVVDASRKQDAWERTFGVVNLYLNALAPLGKSTSRSASRSASYLTKCFRTADPNRRSSTRSEVASRRRQSMRDAAGRPSSLRRSIRSSTNSQRISAGRSRPARWSIRFQFRSCGSRRFA